MTNPLSWTEAVDVYKNIRKNIFDKGLLNPLKLERSSVLGTKSVEYSRITDEEWFCLVKRAATDCILEQDRIPKDKEEREILQTKNPAKKQTKVRMLFSLLMLVCDSLF